MTISLESSATTLTVGIHDAVDLNGAAVELRLPTSCAYERLLPGALLERAGNPLAIAGPNSSGALLAASVLPRGKGPVSGDGTLLVLGVEGPGCTNTPTLLRATAYAADGTSKDLPTELPESGTDGASTLLVIAVLIAWGVKTLRPEA